jgi:hypothetical protein
MLNWFRRHAPPCVAAAILLLAAMNASELVPHGIDCHDQACDTVYGSGTAVEPGIGSADASGSDAQHEHCLFCHFARSGVSKSESTAIYLPAFQARRHASHAQSAVPASPSFRQPSLRAPPSTPVQG